MQRTTLYVFDMKSLIRLQPFFYPNITWKLFHFRFSNPTRFAQYSSFVRRRPSKPNKSLEIRVKKQHELESSGKVGSLFNEISEILGDESFVSGDNSSGFSVSEGFEQSSDCTPSVCGNAEESVSFVHEGASVSGEKDLSPVVHRVTQIVRREGDSVPMEERLENSGLEFSNPEIVEKVLKRCFKVPHLAMRFFNFVKLKDGFRHTSKTYQTMLYIAGEAKKFKLVEKLVEEMEQSSCEKDIKTWTILILHYGKANLIGKVLASYDKMIKSGFEPDEVVYKTMIRSLCDAGEADIAMEFYKEMAKKGIGLNLTLYKMLLSRVAKSGDDKAVRLLADDMIRVLQIPEAVVYSSVLKSFCIFGRIREALEFIRDHKDKDVTFGYEHFETLVRGLCRADRIGDALEIFEIMQKRGLMDEKIYGIVINGYLRRNEISKALDLFQTMKELGHCPTASTYTELMQNLFKMDRYEEGCKLYNEMLESGVEPDIVAITAVVAGHVRANRVPEAWQVFRSMQGRGIRPTWKSYSVFVRELCRISRSDEILKVLEEMRVSEIFIGDDIFHWVISYMERKGESDNLELVKQLQRSCKLDDRSDISTDDVITEKENNIDLRNKSEPEVAEVTSSHQPEPLPKTCNEEDLQKICRILLSPLHWSSIQEALEKCTVEFTPELVLEVLRNCNMNGYVGLQFFSWIGKQTNYKHTLETYNAAIKLAGQGKDFVHMRNLFYEMRRHRYSITADTWTIMIMQYGRTGLTELALDTFKEMKANKCNPTASTYKYLIISLSTSKRRNVSEAMKVFQEMTRAGIVPDKELVESYLRCLCETGNLSAATKCVDVLHKAGFSVALGYSLYIRALCRAGRLEDALALTEEIETDRTTLDLFTYGSIFHGLLMKGRVEEALAKMDSMKKAGINPTVHVYTSLIIYYLKEKQLEKALETLEKMKEEGCEPTTITYSAFIGGYVDMGKVAEAWNVFNLMKMKGPLPDFRTYSMFISVLCKAGKSSEAMKLIDEMLNNGIVPSTVNFRTVFHGLNREGKQSLARTVMQQKRALNKKRKFLT